MNNDNQNENSNKNAEPFSNYRRSFSVIISCMMFALIILLFNRVPNSILMLIMISLMISQTFISRLLNKLIRKLYHKISKNKSDILKEKKSNLPLLKPSKNDTNGTYVLKQLGCMILFIIFVNLIITVLANVLNITHDTNIIIRIFATIMSTFWGLLIVNYDGSKRQQYNFDMISQFTIGFILIYISYYYSFKR